MGYWGSYIHGHSGTQRKNRVAFEKVKAFNKLILSRNKSGTFLNKEFSPPQIVGRKSAKSKLEPNIKIGMFLSLIIALGACIYFISPRDSINSVVTQVNHFNTEIRNAKSRAEINERKESYSFLVKSGKSYLYSQNLDEAQLEFARALHYDENGIEARKGLLKILELRCNNAEEQNDKTEELLAVIRQLEIVN